MITSTRSPSIQDFPLVLALVGLGLVVGGLIYLESPTTFFWDWILLESWGSRNIGWIGVSLFSLGINSAWLYSILSRLVGFSRQGSRLELLTGKKSNTGTRSYLVWLIPLLIGLLVFGSEIVLRIPDESQMKELGLKSQTVDEIVFWLRLNLAFGVFVVMSAVGRLSVWRNLERGWSRRMPPMPEVANGIVIGTIGEDEADKSVEWVSLNRKALNGNVLITGSIGSGKTQGTILPFLDQVLANFRPRPSILALDPKGTFIPEALKIIEKRGLKDHVLHLKLGGNVTFNPIYGDRPLKGAHFLDVAQMIRAAAVNFMGKSFDSPFWEVSAFNLIKNCLVLCGAKYRSASSDFGLTDLYREMIETSKDSKAAAKRLRSLSDDAEKAFDPEEKFNIECAARYFDEYELLDEKVKTGVLATSTAFLNQFQEFQAAQIFCPKYDQATIKSMDEVVDQGKILLFDISSPALAKSMGTFVKLHYQQSVLSRLMAPARGRERTALLISDEYQDVVSTGAGMTIGDDRYCAKNREANGIAICATQSLTSLKNSIGKEDAAKELIQNFRTIIAGHSTDLATIRNFQELAGQEDRKRISHSVSENAYHPSRNLIVGGFESKDANISESISTSEQREYVITGKEFSRLSAFETFALIYDGIESRCRKLFLKPYFLDRKELPHSRLLLRLREAIAVVVLGVLSYTNAYSFPTVCTVVKSSEFRSCLGLSVGSCMCGWPVPRPCAKFSYYVPQTFIEAFPNPKTTHFGELPGAAAQLASLGSLSIPFGAEADDDTQSFHAHALGVPFASIPFSALPCGGARMDQLCFDAMSEHLGSQWSTGSGDLLQPNFLAWSLSPKACLLKGALSSTTGSSEPTVSPSSPSCSVPMGWLPKFPPSGHSACNGWGTFYPRSGVYHGPSQTTGALMIASRMKSLGAEVFHATPSSTDELWQMISPQSSSCFREGQNVGVLDAIKNVREIGRITNGKLTGYLFTVWSQVSCCRDLAEVPAVYVALEAIQAACNGVGTF